MYAQLRMYTVNRGKMDDWVEWFNDKLRPIAQQADHTILGPWINEAKTEFVWIRTYDIAADAEGKTDVSTARLSGRLSAEKLASFSRRSR